MASHTPPCFETITSFSPLPVLKILKVYNVQSKSLASLIENTNGYLTEISTNSDDNDLIQAIYRNCSNLKYLKLSIKNNYISELEKLLNNCKYLNGLIIKVEAKYDLDWDNLFNILIKSSPTSLFKFKFHFSRFSEPKSESLKLFFDNWKGRHPMLLHTNYIRSYHQCKHFDLINKYKTEGIIKRYDNDCLWIEF